VGEGEQNGCSSVVLGFQSKALGYVRDHYHKFGADWQISELVAPRSLIGSTGQGISRGDHVNKIGMTAWSSLV